MSKTLSGDIAATLSSGTDDVYKSAAANNEWKEVHVTMVSGGAAHSIWELFGGKDYSTYFAPNLKLFLDSDTGVSFKVSAKYVPVLEQLMKKFKGSMIGKAVGLIQKMSDLAAGLDLNKAAEQLQGKKTSGSTMLDKIRALPANVRYQTKYQNLPAWESTGPLELGSFTFKFYLGMAGVYNARTEVYNPALAFMKVNQPSEIKTGVLQGPLPNTAWVYGVIGNALGKSIATTIRSQGGIALQGAAGKVPTLDRALYQQTPEGDAAYKKALDELRSQNIQQPEDTAGKVTSSIEASLDTMMSTFEGSLNDAINVWPGTGLIQLSIGKFVLPKMTVENTDVKFSYDTDDNGYPIWAEVTWSGCKTLEVATVQQMPLHDSDSATSVASADPAAVTSASTYAKLMANQFPAVQQITSAADSYADTATNANAIANAQEAGGVITATPASTSPLRKPAGLKAQ